MRDRQRAAHGHGGGAGDVLGPLVRDLFYNRLFILNFCLFFRGLLFLTKAQPGKKATFFFFRHLRAAADVWYLLPITAKLMVETEASGAPLLIIKLLR